MNKRLLLISFVCTIFLFLLVQSCTEKYPPSPMEGLTLTSESGCVNCHFNKELLKEVATPVEHQAESGEG